MPFRTIARIAAFNPGQSPPPVSTPMRTRAPYSPLKVAGDLRTQALHQGLDRPHADADEEHREKDKEGRGPAESEAISGHQPGEPDGGEKQKLHRRESTRPDRPSSPSRRVPHG